MTRDQSIRYNIAKQEFKDQMDPTDLSRSFYVTRHCDVHGFLIVRSNGKTLAYNAVENQYSYSSENEPTIFDLAIQNGSVVDLPPYEYHLNTDGEKELFETHVFPDPSTTGAYESLRLLREATGEKQFTIALTMTELLPTQLTETQLFLMANKAILLYNTNSNNFSMKEITDAITFLSVNGLPKLIDATKMKTVLLAVKQESFNYIITYLAEDLRNHNLFRTTPQENSKALLEIKFKQILFHLKENSPELFP